MNGDLQSIKAGWEGVLLFSKGAFSCYVPTPFVYQEGSYNHWTFYMTENDHGFAPTNFIGTGEDYDIAYFCPEPEILAKELTKRCWEVVHAK